MPWPGGARLPRAVIAGVAGVTLCRLAFAAALPLGDDETFYWEWSRHLAAGYVDHPPAIAWLIRASTALVGPTPFAIHLVPAVLLGLTSLALWMLAREVTGRDDAATWSVILFNVIPVFAAGGLLAAPDGPLGLAWVLVLLWVWRAAGVVQRDGSWRQRLGPWLLAGLWLGLAFDSKYAAFALPVSLGAWLAAVPRYRPWLYRPEPYAALGVAGLLLAPVLAWNATHQWASFAFTLARPHSLTGPSWPVFLGLQFVYLGPLFFPLLVWALVMACRRGFRGDERWLFLAAPAIPVIVGALAASAVGAAQGHWAAPAYITVTIALAALVTERPWALRSTPSRVWLSAAGASALLITLVTHALPALSASMLPPRLDPTVDYYGWSAAAPEIAAVARRGAQRPFFITSDRYQVLAQFDYSTGGRYPLASVTGRDQYAYWARWSDLRGRDALFIQDGRYPPEVDLTRGCGAVQRGPSVPVVRRGVVVRTFDLLWCRDFQGHPIRPFR